MSESRRNIERLYTSGRLQDALNAFIEAHIEVERDASGDL